MPSDIACDRQDYGDGSGLGPDGVVYPGDPAHCSACFRDAVIARIDKQLADLQSCLSDYVKRLKPGTKSEHVRDIEMVAVCLSRLRQAVLAIRPAIK